MNPRYGLLVMMLLLGACAGPSDPLVVKQFQLRNEKREKSDEPLVRNEKERRLHGAVSLAERRLKLGQYYTMLWSDPEGAGKGEAEVIFEYQQGATASRVKKMGKSFPASDTSGQVDFAVIGEDYFKNGRVLAWKASLLRDKRVIASRQSYLWR